jgi:flagellar hook assembly protein FlgD
MAPTGAKVVAAGEASYEVTLDYGAHTLTVSVKDVAGNAADVEVNFIVEGDILKLVKPHNYPNPTKDGKTKIKFGLSQASDITVDIYDFTGTLVCSIPGASGDPMPAGVVELEWDGTRDGDILANGVYFCKVLAETDSETKYEIVKIAIAR